MIYTLDDWKQDTRRAREGLPVDCAICGAGVRGQGVLCGECQARPEFGRGGMLAPSRFVARVNVARAEVSPSRNVKRALRR